MRRGKCTRLNKDVFALTPISRLGILLGCSNFTVGLYSRKKLVGRTKEDLTTVPPDEYGKYSEGEVVMLSIQDVWLRFLRVLEVVDEAVTAGSYEALEKGLARELSALGRELIQQAVEAVDERLREHAGERPGWVIVRRNDVKELLTPFGPVRYGHTYFRNKATGEYRYLADDWLGLTPHARVAPSVKATLVEKAAETSYRKSGQWSWNAAWQVSGQTVMNAQYH